MKKMLMAMLLILVVTSISYADTIYGVAKDYTHLQSIIERVRTEVQDQNMFSRSSGRGVGTWSAVMLYAPCAREGIFFMYVIKNRPGSDMQMWQTMMSFGRNKCGMDSGNIQQMHIY